MQTMLQHQQETSWPKRPSPMLISETQIMTQQEIVYIVYINHLIEKLYEKDPPFASTFVELDKTDHSKQELEGWLMCRLVGMMSSYELLGYCSYKLHDHDYILASA
uniref:Uncharacterized protein n=1 Tax=Spongospora subterranea TaxID=70186 RepID=A0A0H5QNB7_9EUKA|eukprot:CRZ03061.1 hypothetical protein [Spongospora subterranea]